jgi:scyllo-inositol 2-dehydrogenase (NAD+)
MKRIKIGVVGLGPMGQIHARHLASIPEARLVAVASRRERVAREVAEQLGAERFYTNYADLFADRELEAVAIATATFEHKEHIVQAAAQGLRIFTEKPIALTLKDTDEALEAVRRAGVRLQVAFMRRFDPAYALAKKKIEEGVIGRPVMFKGISRDPKWPAHEDDDPRVSGGFFTDMGVHDYDLARWLMGQEVKEVYAIGRALVYPRLADYGDMDNGLINLVFADGSLGNIDLSRNARYGYDIRTEVLGAEGGLWIGTTQQTQTLVLTRGGVTHDVYPWYPERFEIAYYNEIAAFIEGLLAGRDLSPTGEDSRAALEIALAVNRSYRTGQPVRLGEPG